MAVDPQKLRVSRSELAKFLPDPRTVRQFEQLLSDFVDVAEAVIAAQAAADAANAAAAAADAAAVAVTEATDLANSYPEGVALEASDAGADVTITISAHDRVYASGTTVPVDGGVLTGLAYSTSYWIAYDQASRTGGAVTYVAYTTSQGNGVNNPNRHFVGAVVSPDAGGLVNDGQPSLPPGGVNPFVVDGGDIP